MFWFEISNAIVDSVMIVFLAIFQMVHFSPDGTLDTFWQSGALTYTAIIFVVSVKVMEGWNGRKGWVRGVCCKPHNFD